MNKKREKFVRLATKRVEVTIYKLRLIGNLSDKRYYEYSQEDVKQIISALNKELRLIKSKFQNSNSQKETEFKLET